MPESAQKIQLPVRDELFRLVHSVDLEDAARKMFPTKRWEFGAYTDYVYVVYVMDSPSWFADKAIKEWLDNRNSRFHVSTSALIRHMCSRGILPEGRYLVVNTEPHPEDSTYTPVGQLSDENTIEGPKGVC